MIIVQVSDTHLKANNKLAYKKVDTTKSLKLCIEHINSLKPKPDLVIFTGDIGDLGSIEEYELFKKIISLLDVPFYIIPGNHDNTKNLKESFKEFTWCQEGKYLQFSLDDYPVRLIGLDSSIEGKSYGVLCKEKLDWLEVQLKSFQDKPTLLFMHHPPINIGIEHMDVQKLLIGVDELGEIVSKNTQVKGIICGHVHRTTSAIWNNIMVSTAASPSHQVVCDLQKNAKSSFIMEPPAVQIYYWDSTRIISHTSYIGKYDGPYPFYDKHGKLLD